MPDVTPSADPARPAGWRRLYRAIFKLYGPAEVGPYEPGPGAAPNSAAPRPTSEHSPGDSAALPEGHHLEVFVDDSGTDRTIAVPDGDADSDADAASRPASSS